MPLRDNDFDTTQAALSWKACVKSGCEVTFATEHGRVARAMNFLGQPPVPIGPLYEDKTRELCAGMDHAAFEYAGLPVTVCILGCAPTGFNSAAPCPDLTDSTPF